MKTHNSDPDPLVITLVCWVLERLRESKVIRRLSIAVDIPLIVSDLVGP